MNWINIYKFIVERKLNFFLLLLFLSISIYIFVREQAMSESSVIVNPIIQSNAVLYFQMSNIFLIFWCVNLFISSYLRTLSYIIFFSVIMGIYFFEVYLRLGGQQPYNAHYAATKYLLENAPLKETFDKRSKLKVIEDLKKKGEDVFPTVFPKDIFESGFIERYKATFFPLAGVSNKRTIMCNEMGDYAFYDSDRYGFNNPDTNWDSERIGWFLTGDSFTQGSCVDRGEGIAGNIEEISNEIVINTGSGGNGPLTELATIIEYGSKLKPSRVIWLYFEGNDLENLIDELNNPYLIRYFKENYSQNLMKRQSEIDNFLSKYIGDMKIVEVLKGENKEEAFFSSIIKLQRIRFYMNLLVNRKKDLKMFRNIILKAKMTTESWGGDFYFVYIPYFPRFLQFVKNQTTYLERDKVNKIVEELGISHIDLYEEILKHHPDPISLLPRRRPGHFTPLGYRKIAQTIVSSID